MAHTALFQVLQRAIAKAQSSNLQAYPATAKAEPLALSRRSVLRCSALAVGAAVAQSALGAGSNSPHSRQPAPRIAIIGGGLAGLNAAYQLQKLGLSATVYEAKARVGGRIQSREGLIVPGLINELGGAFINSDHHDLLALVDELGLSLFDRRSLTQALPFPEAAFYFAGRTIAEPELIEAIYPLAEQIGQDVDRLNQDFDRYAPGFDALSVADYLDLHSQKIAERYVRSLIEATIRTEYGVEADQSSALQLLYNLPSVRNHRVEMLCADEVFMVQGGSGLIPQTLAARLDTPVRTGWRLQSLRPRGTGFSLGFNQGVVEADYVVLAAAFPALRRMELQLDLPTGLRQFIQEGNPGCNEKLFAGFSSRPWHQAQGFVGGAWSDMGYSGLWEDTQRQPEQPQGVLTFFLGGQEVRQLQGDVAAQGRRFVEDTSRYLTHLDTTAGHRYARTHWGQDPDFGGGYTNFGPGQYLKFKDFLYVESAQDALRQTVQVGHLVFAGEQFSDEYYGYMNGAAQTGRLAAGVIARQWLGSAGDECQPTSGKAPVAANTLAI